MIFVNTDISQTTISPETVSLKTEIEDYLNIATVPALPKLRDFARRITNISDEKSRVALETWFFNRNEVSNFGVPGYLNS